MMLDARRGRLHAAAATARRAATARTAGRATDRAPAPARDGLARACSRPATCAPARRSASPARSATARWPCASPTRCSTSDIVRGMDYEDRFRVRPKGFALAEHDTGDTAGIDEAASEHRREEDLGRLDVLQERLWANDRRGAARRLPGDGCRRQGRHDRARHVRRQPAGRRGALLQAAAVARGARPRLPVADEPAPLPPRGRIGIFNRSYYEEVLVVRVHPEILAGQKLPPELVKARIWKQRYEDIAALERTSPGSGTSVRQVLPPRLEGRAAQALPAAHRGSGQELEVLGRRRRRAHALGRTTCGRTRTRSARRARAARPVVRVPADHKWFMRLVVASALVDALADLDLRFPSHARRERRDPPGGAGSRRSDAGPRGDARDLHRLRGLRAHVRELGLADPAVQGAARTSTRRSSGSC